MNIYIVKVFIIKIHIVKIYIKIYIVNIYIVKIYIEKLYNDNLKLERFTLFASHCEDLQFKAMQYKVQHSLTFQCSD